MARTLITVPPRVRRDEVFELRVMIAHPMETGYRPGADGQVLARDLIRRFSVDFDDGARVERMFSAELHAAVAANPYLAFTLRVPGEGRLLFHWSGDNGFRQTESVPLVVV